MANKVPHRPKHSEIIFFADFQAVLFGNFKKMR